VPETSRETSARIKAVLFDADGVLQGARPGWKERLTGLVPPERGAEFLDEVFAAELPPLRGEGSFPDELAKVLTRWNLTVDVHDVLTVWNDIEVYDDALDVVREVRATGTTVCLATNQQAYRALYMRANLGYDTLFDAEFYSCDLRLAKPDPAYFQAILTHLSLPAATVLFIDDNALNVEGAQTAGLQAAHHDASSGTTHLRTLLTTAGVLHP